MPKVESYKVGVKTAGDKNWAYNALRFDAKEAAEDYGFDLSMRWTAVEEYEVHESEDEPNRFSVVQEIG